MADPADLGAAAAAAGPQRQRLFRLQIEGGDWTVAAVLEQNGIGDRRGRGG